jgi:hypothetical protein
MITARYGRMPDMRTFWMVAVMAALACAPCRSDGAAPAPAAAADQYCTVYGAVGRQGRYVFQQGMTVTDTLNLAGGAKPTANLKTIQLARKDNTGKTVMIFIPFVRADAFPLKPGDVIIVKGF